MGLVADSLDMLADSFVYGISLFAVGGTLIKKKRIAKLAGYFQITLAIIGFLESFKTVFWRRETSRLFDNDYCFDFCTYRKWNLPLHLMQKSKSKEEAHMKASMIFTSNDVIINLGVIISRIFGALVEFRKT